MPTILDTLLEQRSKLDEEFQSTFAPIFAEDRDFTPEEEAKVGEHRATSARLNDRILALEEDKAAGDKLAEARKRSGISAPVVVREEEHTYLPDNSNGNKYFRDLCIRAIGPSQRGFEEACSRLNQHGREVMRDAVNDPVERARVMRAGRENFREAPQTAREFVNEIESRRLDPNVPELRTGMDTTSGSGGSFVTPQYFVSDYAPYRTFGRVFADLCNAQPLPDYGVEVYLPSVESAAGVAAQAANNAGIIETDPTAGYLSSGLTTEAGQVTVAQQLLDRAGPNFPYDKMIFDQLQRSYATSLDAAVLLAVLANANTVTDTFTTATTVTADLYSDTANAIQKIETAPGVVLSPTHIFATPTQWAFNTSQLDANGRPLIVPSYAGPYNAIAASLSGKENVVPEGDTGFELMSLPVYKDGNIPASGSNTQIVVAHMPEVWLWEGSLVPRTIPQTVAQNLSVLLQVYSYWALIVRYTKAVTAISGARYPSTPTFPQS